ncbi:hypothetical protein ACN47E_009649 [Coniothyrium glycines]
MQQKSILHFLQDPKTSRPVNSRPGQPYHRRPKKLDPDSPSSSSNQPRKPHRGPNTRRNTDLQKIADETLKELPKILTAVPGFHATESLIVDLDDLAPLDPAECPGISLPDDDASPGTKGTRIRVFDTDTLDCALQLQPSYTVTTHLHRSSASRPSSPTAVLNLASERSPGGGWLNGAVAQEECLCYRSSLALSLHKAHYPLPSLSAIYSPSVVVLRAALAAGHALLRPGVPPANLPVVSVISIAALRRPALTADGQAFGSPGQRAETKRKIRLTLRVAAHRGHRKLVLGALGCGVFANPAGEVAACFLEVLREQEFQGGWWEDVAFAVLDNVKSDDGGGKDGKGNFGIFYRALDGQVV